MDNKNRKFRISGGDSCCKEKEQSKGRKVKTSVSAIQRENCILPWFPSLKMSSRQKGRSPPGHSSFIQILEVVTVTSCSIVDVDSYILSSFLVFMSGGSFWYQLFIHD